MPLPVEEYPLFQPWYDSSDVDELKKYIIKEDREKREYTFHRRRWKGNTEFNRMFKSETVTIIPVEVDGEKYFKPKSVHLTYGPFFGKKREQTLNYLQKLKNDLKRCIGYDVIEIKPSPERLVRLDIDCEKVTIHGCQKIICSLFELEENIIGMNFYSPEFYGPEIFRRH